MAHVLSTINLTQLQSRLFDLNGEAKTARTKQSSANVMH